MQRRRLSSGTVLCREMRAGHVEAADGRIEDSWSPPSLTEFRLSINSFVGKSNQSKEIPDTPLRIFIKCFQKRKLLEVKVLTM